MTTIQTINPATGKILKNYQTMSMQKVTEIIDNSHKRFNSWRQVSYENRANLLCSVAKLLKSRVNEYAKLITTEMGKPITQARQEIIKCAWACEHYAEHSAEYLKDKMIITEHKKSFVTYNPLGIIFAIMPWNFPFWQVFRFVAPTLMAGNAVILAHANICTGTSLAIEQLFLDAGAPKNLFNSIIIDHEQSACVIAHNKIAAVTLTGSDKAGSIVGAQAAKNLKKIVLELGGSDPYIILADADLELAAKTAVSSRLNNTGQVCIAAKRFIIEEKIAHKFKQLVLAEINNYKMGNPLDESVNLGPLAREDLKYQLEQQVKKSIDLGAVNLLSDIKNNKLEHLNKFGFYCPVAVLDNIKPNMPAYHEELFGPVICFFTAKDEKEAIDIANDTKYGLAAAVFSKNEAKALDIAVNKLNVGIVAVNNLVTSDPRLPFGGTKSSGYGRELGQEGILEFVNSKTVVVY